MAQLSEPDTGYIYCLSNESYNNTYKIGFTKNDPMHRITQLNTTGLLFPFKLEFAKQVKNHQEKEKKLHVIFDKYRVNKNREFFKLELKEIKQLFDLIDGIWYKPNKESPKLLSLDDSRYKPVPMLTSMPKPKPKHVPNANALSEKSSLFGTKSQKPNYSSTQSIKQKTKIKSYSNCDPEPNKIFSKSQCVGQKTKIKSCGSDPSPNPDLDIIIPKTPQQIYAEYVEYMNQNKISSNQVITHCARCFDKFEKSFLTINCIHDNICKHCTNILRKCPTCNTPYN